MKLAELIPVVALYCPLVPSQHMRINPREDNREAALWPGEQGARFGHQLLLTENCTVVQPARSSVLIRM